MTTQPVAEQYKYECWMANAIQPTVGKIIVAPSSFLARKQYANEVGCHITDVVSVAVRYK